MLNKRKQARILRNQLTYEQYKEYSKVICEKVQRFITDKNVIMVYNAIDNEVDLSYLNTNGKTVVYPRCVGENLIAVNPNGFFKGSFNIDEPIGEEFKNKIDAVLVPMCAFDENLNRLGFGKGYYDRFLNSRDCLKIGVAFSCQKTENILRKETDVIMDIIVTEKEIIGEQQ